MGSQSYDPPEAPSYATTQMETLLSYKDTNPQYRAEAMRGALGANYAERLNKDNKPAANAAQIEWLQQLQPLREKALKDYNDAVAAEKETGLNHGVSKFRAERLAAIDKQIAAATPAATGGPDYSSFGDIDVAKGYGLAALDLGDEQARRQLALRQELGVRNVEQSRKEFIAADPEGYAQNQALKKQVFDRLSSDANTAVLGDVLKRDRSAWQDGNADLAKILADTKTEYGLGAKLDESTAREVEQAARQAQASRGNILGIGAASQEAMALGSAGEARKQQRLANYSTAIGAVNTDNDRLRSNLLGTDTAKYAREQQGVANKQSFYLGTPLSAQFSTLGAAGGGAVNYNPAIGNQGAQVANGNAGSQYALGVYGQQSQNAATAASQSNPWMNMAMGVAGTALGAYTGGLGAGFAAQTFANGSAGQQAAIGRKY